MLRLTDDAVTAGLRQFLAKEREYTGFLARLETDVARRLRFTTTSENSCATTTEFLQFAAQLAYLHGLFADRLERIIDDASGTVEQVAAVLEDLLEVTRVVYARLHVHQPAINKAVDSQLKAKTEQTLKAFLQSEKLTGSQQLVSLLLTHFDDAIERAEIIIGSAKLTATCEATREFLQSALRRDRQERELIDLQRQLKGSALETDFCGRELVWRGVVQLSPSQVGDGLAIISDAAGDLPVHDVCCLDDGTVLFIEKAAAADSAPTGLCINLKNDAVFKESVPRSISSRSSMVLLGPTSGLYLSAKDESSTASFHELVECTASLLQHNATRINQLKHGRSADTLELPDELKQQVPQQLVVFPCFHDDELPGVFWLQQREHWGLVELVQCGSWLLVFGVNGWRRHQLLHRVDLASAATTICETQREEDNWALVLSTGSDGLSLELVSARRQRIDFWFDQVSKAIAAAAAERKKQEAQAARAAAKLKAAEEAAAAAALAAEKAAAAVKDDSDGFINARSKKRQRNTVPAEDTTPTPTATSTPTASTPTASTPTASTPTKNQLPTPTPTPPSSASKTKKRRKSDQQPPTSDEPQPDDNAEQPRTQPDANSTAVSATKRQRTPPVKTPKQRWVTRKTDDPDDATLEATQPSAEPDTTTPRIRIVFTGIEPTPKAMKKIQQIPHAAYEEDVTLATHVVAPANTLKRTVKLLCGISCCDHIVDEQWLDESARLRTAVYERQHCLTDATAEAKWKFDLRKTMYTVDRAARRQLFRGHRVFITPHKSILPPVQDLVKIVECAGGQVATTGTATKDDLVITSEAALATAAVQKMLAAADPARLFSPELVLSGILQQRLDLAQHGVDGGAARGRRR